MWSARREGGERVALKFLQLGAGSFDARRLVREAQVLRDLQHPHIIEFQEVLLDPAGYPVLVMELLQGEPLSGVLRRGALSLREVSAVLQPIAEALHFVHLKGLVHRDLKPSNLFLARGPGGVRPVLLDFGLVKLLGALGTNQQMASILTRSGDLLGTPHYMAPEQLAGERSIDHHADIWSFGVILYECLAGRRPFQGETLGQLMKEILLGGVTPLRQLDLGLPPGLVALVDCMLQIRPGERPESMVLAREMLRGAAVGVVG